MKHTVIKAVLRNAQAIEGEVTLWFNKTRIVQFIGNNNNGKSIFFKVAEGVIKQRFSDKDYRLSMINYDYSWGEIEFHRSDGAMLKVHFAKKSADTYYKLSMPDKEPVVRYIKDKNTDLLVAEFGFHYDKETGISLNIYSTFDPMLFINTTATQNDKVITYAVTSAKAENIHENAKLTLKTVEDEIKKNNDNIITATAILKSIPVYDINKLREQEKKLKVIVEIGKSIKPLKLKTLKRLPSKELHNVVNKIPQELVLNKLKNVRSKELEVIHRVVKSIPNKLVLPIVEHYDLTEIKTVVDCVPDTKIVTLLKSKKANAEKLASIHNVIKTIPDFKVDDISNNIEQEFTLKRALINKVCPTCGRPYFDKEGCCE